MIDSLPLWVNLLFLLSFCIAVAYNYLLTRNTPMLILIVIWAVVQSILAFNGFYQNNDAIPPRFLLVIVPSLLFVIGAIFTPLKECKQRKFALSTSLHSIRIPVEIVLHQLFIYGMIPKLMTYEGRNFDIIIGISAIIVAYLVSNNKISKTALLAWNIVGLAFVLFIFFNALLSAELPIQQFAFDQPNRAVTYFPFILLPAVIVPIVISTHIYDIRCLRRQISMGTD